MKQCKLCLELVTELKNSHFLPAGIYKRLRDEEWNNPNPWKITNRTAVQTSKQQTTRLLCNDCEQRFSKNGEDWVLKYCQQQDGNFPLASILAARKPDESSNNNPTKIYYASNIPEINISALAYFAASMFWRGSVHPWNDDGSAPVKLGPFEEQFRQYLTDMDLKGFPKDCTLLVVVREGESEVSRLTFPPSGGRKGKFHVYRFPIPGLAFSVAVGKNIPAEFHRTCFVRGYRNPIAVTPFIEPFLTDYVVKMLKKIHKCPF